MNTLNTAKANTLKSNTSKAKALEGLKPIDAKKRGNTELTPANEPANEVVYYRRRLKEDGEVEPGIPSRRVYEAILAPFGKEPGKVIGKAELLETVKATFEPVRSKEPNRDKYLLGYISTLVKANTSDGRALLERVNKEGEPI